MTDNMEKEKTDAGYLNGGRIRRMLFVILIAWALLPAFAAVGYIFCDLTYADYADNILFAYEYRIAALRPMNLYMRLFYILGTVTTFAALLCLCACPRRLPWIKRAARLEPWHGLLLFVLLWSVPSTLLSDNPLSAFLGSPYRFDGLYSYFIFASVYVCALFYSSESGRLWLLRVFVFVANLCVAIEMGQAFQIPIFTETFPTTGKASVFFQFNHFGYYLSVSILCSVGLYLYDKGTKRKIWYLLGFAFQVYGLLLNETFGSWLAVVLAIPAALVYYAISGKKITSRALIPVALFLLINIFAYTGILPGGSGWKKASDGFLPTVAWMSGQSEKPDTVEYGTSVRGKLWKKAVELTIERPVFGFGPDGTPAGYGPPEEPHTDRPHNALLQIAMFLGIPALLAYLSALFLLFFHQWKRLSILRPSILIAAGVVTAYLLSTFTGVPVFYTTPYLFLFLGLVSGRSPLDPLNMPDTPELTKPENTPDTPELTEPENAPEDTPELTKPKNAPDIWKEAFERRRIPWLIGVLCLCLMVLTMRFRYAERTLENADVVHMELAGELAADALKKDMRGGYWYEPVTGSLLPEESDTVNIPPYGMGSALKGGCYIEKYLNGLPYDESADYQNKILHVAFDRDLYGDQILLDWIPVTGVK